MRITNKFLQFREFPIQTIKNLFHLTLPNYVIYRKLRKLSLGSQIVLNHPPLYITVCINGYCMNSCKFCASHCPDSGKNENTKHQYNLPFNMKFEQFKKMVDIAYKAKVPHLHIVGAGEPFLNREILKMMDYLASKYCKLSVQTNFNRAIFEERNLLDEILKRKNRIIRITSDIFAPDDHNLIKRGSDYKYLMDSLEYLSQNSRILFDLHTILTKQSYKNLYKIILDLVKRKINFEYSVVNLHPYNFNEFTSPANCYLSEDKMITLELDKLKRISQKLNAKIHIPKPWDQLYKDHKGNCLNFWNRFQVIPDKKIPKEKWIGNIVSSQCCAVVNGDLVTLGNIFESKDFFEIWNNEYFRTIRKNLMKGIYPDDECKKCYKYSFEFDKSL